MMSKMDGSKYEQYYDQKYNTKSLQPHQILAINRAEQAKFLHVYLHFHDYSQQFIYESWQIWSCMRRSKFRDLFNEVLVECYENILMPLLKRTKRSELKSYAEKASLKVFSQNLKQILLAAPVKGKRILGVDPGFTHGCKLGVISETGSVLATSVVFPHIGNARKIEVHEKVFRDLLIEHNCSLIALGNGTACRETEAWITDMIARGMFQPLDVSYWIVNESGASIYSCSKEAIKEFADLDPNKISAVSLARRVQDPLSELVKVEPKHLGIGMYQHDVNRKRLKEALTDVVSECVSFVGVDLNTASQCLLKHVAGLTEKRAADVIAFREANGAFSTREQLLKVRGIDSHSFKQCAGFLKIFNGENKLEVTSVHPESYDVAKKLLLYLNLSLNDVGTEAFAQIIRNEQPKLLDSYATLGTSRQTLETILESLSEPINYDLRDKADKRPLFRSETTRIESLQEGMRVTGRVDNVTSFGSFVDIGVGTNGLLHIKQSNGVTLQIGDHIEVLINRVDLDRMRISLKLCQKFCSNDDNMSFLLRT